jgi:glycosyltransferase involved in cell wall biosynthesis
MYKNKTIAVVVPAYNEEKQIEKVLKTIPKYVDKVVVIDDSSKDNTKPIVKKIENNNNKVILLSHKKNQGVGGAIITGYKWVINNKIDIAAVMAGDGQMDPSELSSILNPIIKEKVDYVKGNRLFTGEAWKKIPRIRYLGNSILSLLTKIASGYWHIADFQSGYTAIKRETLELLELDRIYKRYGMPNDFLVKLNVIEAKVKDVPIKPRYNIGEKSGIKMHKVIPIISWLLFKRFLWRMKQKYIIRDFHPLVFFYVLGFLTFPLGLIFGLYLFFIRILVGPIAATSALFAVFLFISGLQSLFFAMWFDMESNKDLKR